MRRGNQPHFQRRPAVCPLQRGSDVLLHAGSLPPVNSILLLPTHIPGQYTKSGAESNRLPGIDHIVGWRPIFRFGVMMRHDPLLACRAKLQHGDASSPIAAFPLA